ncbi:adhesion G protein-coupled receptor F5-like [Rhinophrynus dorsalis]
MVQSAFLILLSMEAYFENVYVDVWDFIKTVDIVVDNTDSWKGVKEKSSKLLLSVEKFAENLVNGSDFKANNNTSNVQLKVTTLNTTSNYNEGFKFTNLTGEVKIRNNSIAGEAKTVVSIAYSTMKDILPSNTTKTVNGLVISTVVVGRNKSDDVSISLTFSKINSSLDNPDCVFWDFNKSQSGDWNNEGCTASETGGFVICTCNHLTSFSMLMGEPKSRNLFLDIITYAGVGISIGCLFIALAIEAVVWKSVIKNKTSYMRHVCLVNISVSLLAADIWFIIGAALEKYPDSDSCLTAAFFSFFFYLSLFFWMLSTGLILFYRLVFILHDISRKTMMIVAFTMGYGCPVVISVITVASTAPTKGFTSRKFCWLDYNTTKTFLAFVVPALTIVFVNCIILLVVICKLVRPTVGEKTGKEERTVLVQISKSLAVLTPLLGITWGFGLGVVATPDSTALHGIFAALNSFQGLFILLSTVLLDQKVRTIVRSTISRSYLSTLRSKKWHCNGNPEHNAVQGHHARFLSLEVSCKLVAGLVNPPQRAGIPSVRM